MVGAGRIQFTVNTRKKLLMWGAWRSFRYFPYVYKPTWLRGYKGAGWVETGDLAVVLVDPASLRYILQNKH